MAGDRHTVCELPGGFVAAWLIVSAAGGSFQRRLMIHKRAASSSLLFVTRRPGLRNSGSADVGLNPTTQFEAAGADNGIGCCPAPRESLGPAILLDVSSLQPSHTSKEPALGSLWRQVVLRLNKMAAVRIFRGSA
jgi:hypothetical protein